MKRKAQSREPFKSTVRASEEKKEKNPCHGLNGKITVVKLVTGVGLLKFLQKSQTILFSVNWFQLFQTALSPSSRDFSRANAVCALW